MRLPPLLRRRFLEETPLLDRIDLDAFWPCWARANQVPPIDREWRNWLLMGGRGAGKTRAGSEWIRALATRNPFFEGDTSGRIALVGETIHDVRSVMIEGESGILSVHLPHERPLWSPALKRLEWPNGVIAQVFSANDPEGLRGSQFGAAWCDETGCPAVNRGANQPNVFFDPKSAQSRLPWFSSGARDDLVQRRYIGALQQHWNSGEPANPVSAVYGSGMVPSDRIWLWAWDARPFPEFPESSAIWSDGGNWQRGHWLNGRLGGCPLDRLIDRILTDYGIDYLPSKTDGFLDGFVIGEVAPLRASLEPLAGLFNLIAREEEGSLRFVGKEYLDDTSIPVEDLVQNGEAAAFAETVSGEVELPREVTLTHGDVFSNYEGVTSQSRRLETSSDRSVSMNAPTVLPPSSGEGLAEARLRDTWNARRQCSFGLPWKYLALEAGDVVSMASALAPASQYRISGFEDGQWRSVSASGFTRFESSGSQSEPATGSPGKVTGFGTPLVALMNLPIGMDAAEPEPAVHVAVWSQPWAEGYTVATSPSGDGFSGRAFVPDPAQIFTLQEPLSAGPLGRWDRASVLKLAGEAGDLESLERVLVLAGGNGLAVQSDNDEWEIVQFQEAALTGDGSWQLTGLLRGQMGTDPAMLAGASAGKLAVLLNDAVVRVPLQASETGLQLNWRVAPVIAGISDLANADLQPFTCTAANRRPLSPVHLKASEQADGTLTFTWVRRSRTGSDNWDNATVPLDEPVEQWRVTVRDATGTAVRTEDTGTASFAYNSSMRTADLGDPFAPLTFEAAQVCASGLPGPATGLHWPV